MWHGSEISNVSINTTRFLEIFFVIRYIYIYHITTPRHKGIPREILASGERRISSKRRKTVYRLGLKGGRDDVR